MDSPKFFQNAGLQLATANQANTEIINNLNQFKPMKCEWKKTNTFFEVNVVNETVTPQQICFIMTIHDLGTDSSEFEKLIHDKKMEGIRNRVIWLNVNLPGQEPESADLDLKKYPSLDELGEGLVNVLNELKIPQVICLGHGAGANIAFHFAIKHASRCLGLVLIDPVGSSAGFVESIRYMFGTRGKSISGESSCEPRGSELRNTGSILNRLEKQTKNCPMDTFNIELLEGTKLTEHRNTNNLSLFADSFYKVDVLIACGKNSTSYGESKKLYKAFQETNRKTPLRMVNSPFLELDHVTSVLNECADRLAVSLQYFLQGIGLLSAMPLRSSIRSASISGLQPTSPSLASYTPTGSSDFQRSISLDEANPAPSGSSLISLSNSESNSQTNLNNAD